MTPETLGKKITDAMKKRGLKVDAFATELGTSRQTVIRWRKAKHVPNEIYAPRVAKRLGIPLREIEDARGPEPRPQRRLAERVGEIEKRLNSLEEVVDAIRRRLSDADQLPGP